MKTLGTDKDDDKNYLFRSEYTSTFDNPFVLEETKGSVFELIPSLKSNRQVALVITYLFLNNKVPKQEGKGCPVPKIWTILPSKLEPIMFGGGCFGNVCNKALGRQIINENKDFILISN